MGTMGRIVLIMCVLFWIGLPNSSAQLLYPEIMEIRQLDPAPIRHAGLIFPKNLFFLKRTLRNAGIENPGVRYAIQTLAREHRKDKQVNEAINTLLRYAENDTVREMVKYMRDYIKTTGEKEEALHIVKNQLTFDSIEYVQDTLLAANDYDTYRNSDLHTLATYIQNDSNYIWLKDISRDSVLMEVLNASDHSVKFWINNGRKDYYRFWAINKFGDSIGTWLQVVSPGNNIRIYVDDDVYQMKMDAKENRPQMLSNKLGNKYFSIRQTNPGDLRRRYWAYYSDVELAMGQGYLANWAGGGENALSLLANTHYYINYNKNKTSWENFVYYRLGFLKSGDESIRKNEEKLEFNSKLGQKAFKHWFYTAQLNIQTMIFNSYEYGDNSKKIVGNFMSPGYFTLSVGLDYKPNDNFSLYLSPIAGKWTYVRDTARVDPTRYGVDAGKKSKSDAGAKVELRNKFKMFNFINIQNELIMFSSYYNSQQSFTANWQVQINFRINYFMQTSIYTNIVYDENYSKKLQFKENLNLGVNFRF